MKAPQDEAPFIYCAAPSRFLKKENWPAKKSAIEDTALKAGYYPIIPFNLDCGRMIMEDHPKIGRPKAFDLFFHLLKFKKMSLGLFGIADGTLAELRQMLQKRGPKFVRTFPGFDENWDKEYEKWSPIYGDPLAQVRGGNLLLVFVGGTAVGKTYWSDRLIQNAAVFDIPVRRVKNITTREPRSVLDLESYQFVTKEEFERMIQNGCFAENDTFRDHHYGSSLARIKRVLEKSHGVLALTPRGAAGLYQFRYEINIQFIVLKASEELLLANLERRGVTDREKQNGIVAEHEKFFLPQEIPHYKFFLDGSEKDERLIDSLTAIL